LRDPLHQIERVGPKEKADVHDASLKPVAAMTPPLTYLIGLVVVGALDRASSRQLTQAAGKMYSLRFQNQTRSPIMVGSSTN
jgi:hypothetical protein